MRELSWKARRRGPIYCAPACGNKCTWEAYQLAKQRAAKLVKALGPGFRTHVHENMGWHASALSECGRLYVAVSYYKGRASYNAFLGEPNSFSGVWSAGGKTPHVTVREVLDAAMAGVGRYCGLVDGLEHLGSPVDRRRFHEMLRATGISSYT